MSLTFYHSDRDQSLIKQAFRSARRRQSAINLSWIGVFTLCAAFWLGVGLAIHH